MIEWFDDLKVGMRFKSEAVTVSKDDIIRFAREYDPQPFHLDDEAARKTILGGLAASGWHACALLMRLHCDGFLNGATSMGAPGIEEVKWLLPLRPGVELSVRRTTLDLRPSKSRPEMGLVRFLFELIADGQNVVMTQQGLIMFGRRQAA